ncbi:MAG: competence protein ComEC [Solirubrobacteraceae bacterium]|nr:competence protein ComEC [Solirubrobacteraceae bacterium]
MYRAITIILAAALLVAAAPASARKGPCAPGSSARCTLWTGKVVYVNDGDTFDAIIGGRRQTVRFTSIQALELTTYKLGHRTGECHAVETANRTEHLLKQAHNRVRLSARNPGARASKGRLLRGVAIKLHGRWRDLGEMLLREGRAAYMTNVTERQFNVVYNRAQQEAAHEGINLFDPDHCKPGPQQELPIQVWANTDPVGIDEQHVNGEQVKIRNLGTVPLALGGWSVRSGTMRKYRIPAGTSVAPGATLTVHAGHGSNDADELFWGLDQPTFPNMGDARHLGSGVYLFDPQADVRAYMLYPCVVACTDPRQGALTVTGHPQRPESATVRNVSTTAFELYGLELSVKGSAYAFPEGAILRPGASRTVDVARDWGSNDLEMPDAGGSVTLRTPGDIRIDCDAWGSGSC